MPEAGVVGAEAVHVDAREGVRDRGVRRDESPYMREESVARLEPGEAIALGAEGCEGRCGPPPRFRKAGGRTGQRLGVQASGKPPPPDGEAGAGEAAASRAFESIRAMPSSLLVRRRGVSAPRAVAGQIIRQL